jgi:isocitrate dehydrogenase (NAD+)
MLSLRQSAFAIRRHARSYAQVKAAAGTYAAQKNSNGNYIVSMIAGDGIGPEISVFYICIFEYVSLTCAEISGRHLLSSQDSY